MHDCGFMLLGFRVENKKIWHYETKPKNGSRKMQTRRSILLPLQPFNGCTLAAEDVDGELEKREDEQSHEQI